MFPTGVANYTLPAPPVAPVPAVLPTVLPVAEPRWRVRPRRPRPAAEATSRDLSQLADNQIGVVGMTQPVAPPKDRVHGPEAMAELVRSPHTGPLLLKLPLTDLNTRGGGAWNGQVSWRQSGLATLRGETVLRTFYKKGSGTSSMPHSEASGMSVSCRAKPLVGAKGVVVAFDIYFDPDNWNWSRGGKLGGLFVGTGKASGGRHSSDGASHRLMWQSGGGAISYVYPPKGVPQPMRELQQSKEYGIGLHKDKLAGVFKVGQWNHVEIGIKMNTFRNGKPAGDGKGVLTINGVTGVMDAVNWARSPAIRLEGFEYGTFFGGPDPAVVDSVQYTKNFEIYEWKD